ncbi:adenylyl-sulfate kinase [Shewanella oneidensis MR-1]|uniref:Adenylyl-sulfate kinase n=1 Tax=Shewanella oneidensis (strain ATCC 700550 / JCM 31522 / CIP 106686 / LMG 19005 / NCIMB 14063 / MR-1) TaxID=211586 RepID=CYSC_SHEON|nr:adenylyl-sulfate kinase [Shewanella oneidensis]Q8EB13.1 RecName: Full=Adenylyl-sulfate kinase; AltName: Full=APS kinase; AltName: Full=ATP adenosine-5'-phosphosulfate 3'-phosphotransferase; AltName: Full=Adenosine-5'-phosphosulfate kinase [Shewanella oneidensis MR-1]AAN56707.1 adenylylsulfate kinase CysC [Shewanella oneidensis MR-1]MDX5998913.1 adenylyl-sulfate kinase [Shewanella oneidensis]MEE2028528.1 Adenylyl-sulfate kinase [Shewanella oneidensis]QKG98052.1 adenylyl-sulfate kinase [Shewa
MSNIVWHQHSVDQAARARLKGQNPVLLWFTGLSGAGKSTLAGALERALFEAGFHTYLLDGDNVRHGLCKDLGFSVADRDENLRRVGEVAKLMVDAGLVVLSAFISPTREERDSIRARFPEGQFIEVHVSTPLSVCELRDPKGLYVKARKGEIAHFTGISSPYEAPLSAELTIDTSKGDLASQVHALIDYLTAIDVISSNRLASLA